MSASNVVRKIERVGVDGIEVLRDHRRPLSNDGLESLIESMRRLGLRTPITVRCHPDRRDTGDTEDSYVLVTGAHRLAAAQALGWDQIDCFVIKGGDDDDQLWEIAENLHRAELTALERDDLIARWVTLTDARQSARPAPIEMGPADVSGQAKEVLRQPDAKPKGGRPESGTRAAARELGLAEADARRAVKVASLAPEAKQAARDAGLDDNRTALLAAAKHSEPEQQVQSLLKRRPVDRARIATNSKERMLREIAAIVVQHVPDEFFPALRVNLEGYGLPQLAEAIARAAKERRP